MSWDAVFAWLNDRPILALTAASMMCNGVLWIAYSRGQATIVSMAGSFAKAMSGIELAIERSAGAMQLSTRESGEHRHVTVEVVSAVNDLRVAVGEIRALVASALHSRLR